MELNECWLVCKQLDLLWNQFKPSPSSRSRVVPLFSGSPPRSRARFHDVLRPKFALIFSSIDYHKILTSDDLHYVSLVFRPFPWPWTDVLLCPRLRPPLASGEYKLISQFWLPLFSPPPTHSHTLVEGSSGASWWSRWSCSPTARGAGRSAPARRGWARGGRSGNLWGCRSAPPAAPAAPGVAAGGGSAGPSLVLDGKTWQHKKQGHEIKPLPLTSDPSARRLAVKRTVSWASGAEGTTWGSVCRGCRWSGSARCPGARAPAPWGRWSPCPSEWWPHAASVWSRWTGCWSYMWQENYHLRRQRIQLSNKSSAEQTQREKSCFGSCTKEPKSDTRTLPHRPCSVQTRQTHRWSWEFPAAAEDRARTSGDTGSPLWCTCSEQSATWARSDSSGRSPAGGFLGNPPAPDWWAPGRRTGSILSDPRGRRGRRGLFKNCLGILLSLFIALIKTVGMWTLHRLYVCSLCRGSRGWILIEDWDHTNTARYTTNTTLTPNPLHVLQTGSSHGVNPVVFSSISLCPGRGSSHQGRRCSFTLRDQLICEYGLDSFNWMIDWHRSFDLNHTC